MSPPKFRLAASLVATSALVIGSASLTSVTARAADYAPIPQDQITLVDYSSEELNGEGSNGRASQVLDGDPDTYWHNQYQGTDVPPPPHSLTFQLADEPVELGRFHLTPRLDNASGLIREYEILTASGDCATAAYTPQKTGTLPFDDRTADRVIALDEAVMANCVQVVWNGSWGGDGSEQTTATLAEFNADTGFEEDGGGGNGGDVQPIEIVVPEGAVELTDGDFSVRLHPDFPQVVDYRLGQEQMAGRVGEALTTVLINEVEQDVTVGAPVVADDGMSATYGLTFPGLTGVSIDAVASVADDTFNLTFTNIVDPNSDVNRLRIPGHNLVTVGAADAESQLTAGMLNVNRTINGDRFENVADTAAGGVQGSWIVMANNSTLAAAFDSNSTDDNTAAEDAASDRVQGSNNRWQRQIVASEDGATKYGSVWAGTWTWLGEAVEEYEGSLGRDDDPYLEVKITDDANADGQVDWQDAGIAARDIIELSNGMEDVKDEVISRIPFNIVSQATHPFLRTLDDTKRISLATDNLRQKVMLKGYQAEGHDSAHPDYAGHYNERAGGFEDLETLAQEGEDYNARFGVHVNATETYSEAYAFDEELLRMPPQEGWGWMNQSYYIDGPKDLATENVLERFQDFWDERPENLDWLYMDVYYPSGWEGERLSDELHEQGWVIGTEWSNKFPERSVWSHWSQDEPYGGQTNKGIESDVIRFVHNARRDAWNPHPILSNSNLMGFEGWTGDVDYNRFIANVWERNLPVKFLQQSDIVKWEDTAITFANGTVATSDVESVSGTEIPTDRTINYDGADVYTDGAYLLPWSDGGENRLYHYNIGGGETTWDLTDAWADQSELTLYELTDTGRSEGTTVTPANGRITLNAEEGVAYVLYPTSDVPTPVDPNWGQGTGIDDPSFFSGTLEAYNTAGDVEIVKTERGNFEVEMGAGEASISQELDLDAGTYSAWAWIMIDRGQKRPVTVEASPVAEAGYSTFSDGTASNTINASTVNNSTASDEKRNTNYQRVRVTFTTDASAPVDFTVLAGDGDANVWVEDLRVVEWSEPADGDATEETIYFQDFENVDVGYWPFVTGYTNRGGDARTQLAERNEPYSQKGWYGANLDDEVIEGGKLNDNVLEGTWSLMANNENVGEILKTAPGAINFESGRKYRVSFDYQTTYADQYRIRLGHDVLTDDGSTAVNAISDVLGEERETTRWSTDFNASSCGVPFIAVDKLNGPNTQHNVTIDNLRVEEIGDADSEACLSGGITADGAVVAGDDVTVSTTVTAYNDSVTDVTHALEVPENWTSSVATAGATDLAFGETSTQEWTVTTPADITEVMEETLVFTGTGTVEGNESSVTDSAMVKVILPPEPGENSLSDLQSNVIGTPTNGWGPVEWDTANGENNAGDGPPLTLGGEVFPKGIGAHAKSTIDYDLSALECTRFQATVGVDDSRGTGGSVQFAVYGDDELIGEQTAVLRGGDTPVELDLDITGVETLSLRITDGGDGNGSDHGNWAGARVTCGDDTTTPPTTTPPTTPPPTTPPSTPSTPVLEYPAKLYQTPGYHDYNGRRWFTRCEPYSATVRCWTSIWSTQVTVQGGAFVSKTGWFHNNLTYLPSDRSTWKGNPLGFTNKWTTSDGRNWYTECDTPATGRNGCRSYLRTDGVVEAVAQPGGGYSYRVVSKWVFNNIVLFN